MGYKIKSVSVVRYPVLLVTFTDGFAGEYDLSGFIGKGPMFNPLEDHDYFNTVAVGEYGHTFGWNLDSFGNEIDFCPDATRIALETQAVQARAAAYKAQLHAAE